MINVELKDGSIKQYKKGISIIDLVKQISEGLAKNATSAIVDGEVQDLRYKLENNCNLNILSFDSDEGKTTLRHTASHVLAQAVKRLYPLTKLAIGPSIENGFYYDFDTEKPFYQEDLDKLEIEMNKICKENIAIERFQLARNDAINLMQSMDEIYKVELINDLPEDAIITFYKQGEFTDLCAGPHLMSTGLIKAIKLTAIAGAYWRGNEKNKMLQRIYGTAFTKKTELEEYLFSIEEAKKRDHNKIGRDMGIFTTSEYVGQGLPLIMPKGAKILQILQRFIEDEEEKRGYLLTKTPYMAKSDLYKISGHWQHYKDGMFVMGDEETENEVFALRPMTCPFQYIIYNSSLHSYRDLPVRYSEASTLFRNESSGEMHGLIRVRQFTLSEGHIIVTAEQLEDEFLGAFDLINYVMKSLGIDNDITYRFSKWDPNNKEKYLDMPEAWEHTQTRMKNILDKIGLVYKEADGEAAFYGPKLDIQFKNVHGKEDTIITIQIDFAAADLFDMYYIDKDNQKKRPYVIHRSSLGCYERTLAMLIEKYAGAFPTWLCPVQVKILPISDRHMEYAENFSSLLRNKGIRVELDSRNEKIGYKIREAQLEKIPYMIVIGDNELAKGVLAIRSRKNGDLGSMSINDFEKLLLSEIENRK